MKQYTLTREEYDGFDRLLQSSVGYRDISGVNQCLINKKEIRMEIRMKGGATATLECRYNGDVNVEIDEKGKTVSQLLENYLFERRNHGSWTVPVK